MTCLRLNLSSFGLLNTSTRSARCRLVSVSIFHALCCTTPRVTLHILTCLRLNLSSFVLLNTSSGSARCRLISVSTYLCCFKFAQHLESLCSLLTCLDCLNLSCFVLNTSTRSARCSVVSGGYLNTLTFVGPVLVSVYPLCRSNFLLLMFHSSELLRISTVLSSLSIRFLSCCFLHFCYILLSSVFTSTNLRTPSQKRTVYRTYTYT